MDEEVARSAFEEAIAIKHHEFGSFFLSRFFQLDITYGDETCLVTLPVHEYMYNPQGSFHGGVIGFALDVAMGHLLKRFVGAGVTLEMKVQYLRALKRGVVSCEARLLKKGRSICYLEARMTNELGALIAVATSTWQLLPGQGAVLPQPETS
jgi:uncharacterized protein (TIGR00369 family)